MFNVTKIMFIAYDEMMLRFEEVFMNVIDVVGWKLLKKIDKVFDIEVVVVFIVCDCVEVSLNDVTS